MARVDAALPRAVRTGRSVMDVVLRAERVLLGGGIRPAAVAVADGLIAEVGDVDADYLGAAEVVIPRGAVLLPGFVDTHVHVNEPGTDWEGFATATAAAAAGRPTPPRGITPGGAPR